MSRRTPLRGWLVSEAVSLTGTRVSMVAIPWFVLTTTGSATQTGLVAFAETAPLVALKALAGPLVDRVGARRVSVACDLGSTLVVGAIPLLHLLDALSFPLLLVLVALAGALRGPGDGAKHALVPAVVDHVGVPMERVTGLASTVERTASMAGAAVAGALVAAVGPAQALVVDALSFTVAAVVLWRSTRDLPQPVLRGRTATAPAGPAGGPPPEPATPPLGYARQLAEGWHFLRREPLLLGITVMVAVTNLLDQAYSVLLLPVWARETGGGAAAVGLVLAVFSGASILGALAASAWAAGLPRFRVYVVAFLLAGAPRFWVFAADAPLWLVLAVVVVGGVASGFINPILGAVVFERIPAPLVGRVSSLTTALCFLLIPFGGLVGGLLVAGAGWQAALAVCGAAYLVATMAPAVGPRFRAMDQRPATAAPAGAR